MTLNHPMHYGVGMLPPDVLFDRTALNYGALMS